MTGRDTRLQQPRILERVPRFACVLLTAVILGVAFAFVVGNEGLITTHGGEDLAVYRYHTDNWLSGRGYYPAYQLAGPFPHNNWNSAYPPPYALFMIPWLVLPAYLWWIIPLGIVAFTVVRWRSAPWSWPLIALCVVAPRTLGLIIWGNSTMWVVAAVAATLYWRIPVTPLILTKPVLAPFAFVGVRDRRWWFLTIAGCIVALVMLPMWPDYIVTVRNGMGIDWTHSLFDTAFVLIPVIAWRARRTT